MHPFRFALSRRSPLRFWLAVGILILALIVFIAAAIPFGVIQQEIKLPPLSLPTATPLSFLLLWAG
jgi:hypothetical protein